MDVIEVLAIIAGSTLIGLLAGALLGLLTSKRTGGAAEWGRAGVPPVSGPVSYLGAFQAMRGREGERIKGWFDNLPESLRPEYGKGPFDELTDAQQENRTSLINRACDIQVGCYIKGVERSIEDCLFTALTRDVTKHEQRR